MESQTKLINIKLIDISDKLEKHIDKTNNLNDIGGALHVEEINFVDSGTKLVVNAKLF